VTGVGAGVGDEKTGVLGESKAESRCLKRSFLGVVSSASIGEGIVGRTKGMGLLGNILPKSVRFGVGDGATGGGSRSCCCGCGCGRLVAELVGLTARGTSTEVRLSLQTSTGSRTARSIMSIPLRWNRAIFASVPASIMTFGRTLWAWRLYKGIIARLVEEEDEREVVLLFAEAESGRGGTSWTWRLRGWLLLLGGGRTKMKDCTKVSWTH